ncbi:unnamed protein product [Gongylonema pulchrum]|uniref:Uncharacterized protein n=1 Tax=Gongylonema pulchrum TaxID=637853 RepID=A0A183DJ00_9BILA|nr:unnamed protein product [Gongylonema pulchrum]
MHEQHIRSAWSGQHNLSGIFLNSELIVLIGFLLILLVEEIVHTCQKTSSIRSLEHVARAQQTPQNGNNASKMVDGRGEALHSTGLPTLLSLAEEEEDTEPLFSDNRSTEGSVDEEAPNTPRIEFRRISDEVGIFPGHKMSVILL